MRPRTGLITGGIIGLVLGYILLAGINGGAIFGMMVGGFIGFDAVWAINTISKTKKLSKNVRQKNNPVKEKEPESDF